MKANKIGQEETISVLLTRNAFPIAFQNKLDELMEQGAFNSEEEATRWIESTPIVLEIMYEKDSGLFGVEAEAIESGSAISPYSGEEIETDCDDCDDTDTTINDTTINDTDTDTTMQNDVSNSDYCQFADVTIKFKDSGETQDVTVSLFPKESLNSANDNEIFFYFQSPDHFMFNRLVDDDEDFNIIKVHNMY